MEVKFELPSAKQVIALEHSPYLHQRFGLTHNAPFTEVRKRWKILAHHFHPERTKDQLTEELNTKAFKVINHAYQILRDGNKYRDWCLKYGLSAPTLESLAPSPAREAEIDLSKAYIGSRDIVLLKDDPWIHFHKNKLLALMRESLDSKPYWAGNVLKYLADLKDGAEPEKYNKLKQELRDNALFPQMVSRSIAMHQIGVSAGMICDYFGCRYTDWPELCAKVLTDHLAGREQHDPDAFETFCSALATNCPNIKSLVNIDAALFEYAQKHIGYFNLGQAMHVFNIFKCFAINPELVAKFVFETIQRWSDFWNMNTRDQGLSISRTSLKAVETDTKTLAQALADYLRQSSEAPNRLFPIMQTFLIEALSTSSLSPIIFASASSTVLGSEINTLTKDASLQEALRKFLLDKVNACFGNLGAGIFWLPKDLKKFATLLGVFDLLVSCTRESAAIAIERKDGPHPGTNIKALCSVLKETKLIADYNASHWSRKSMRRVKTEK